jgi:Tol biopolymer transport system component
MKTPGNRSALLAFLILLTSFAVIVPDAAAQYFGRNKIQYQRFNFRIIKTKHFDVYFYPEFKAVAEESARMAERWYARISRILNHELRGRQPLILYSSAPDFQQTTTTSEAIGEGTGGFTEPLRRRIVLPVGTSPAETDHVIGHELVHAFQYDITTPRGPGGGMEAGAALARLPLWFIEGMAEYISIGPVDPNTATWMRDAWERKELPRVKKLSNPYKYFPYRYGQALWAYVTGRWGDEMIPRLMRSVGRVGDIEGVMSKILGVKFDVLSKDWLEAYQKAYEPVLKETRLIEPASKVLFKGTELNVYNISPVLSPDGRLMMFLSTRDLFSIDLYLADVQTGKIKQKITETAITPEFESLQFIKSAGAWDPAGKRFVFGAIAKGRPILTFYDVAEGKISEEIGLETLDEIFSPSYSPDGRSIAFSGLHAGQTDLFIYDLEEKKLRQLTDDFFADLHPSWSPDGRTIALVTDRFATDLSLLSYGDYELALVDPVSGKIDRLDAFTGGKNTNPQWSPDSKSLYFLSDQSGKSDIFRLDLASRKIYQVTNLFTGVSGITELSPAISVAEKTGRLAYSAYDHGRYSIFSIEAGEALQGDAAIAQFGGKLLSVLPPREQPSGALLGLLRNPLYGLPEQTEFPESGYKPKLALEYVAPPQIGVGVDRFGTYAGGGAGLYWGDMLGYHQVGTIFQTSGRLKDFTSILTYQNSQHRLSWGGALGRIPYVYGGYNAGFADMGGQPVIVEQEELFWQFNYEAIGFLSYPFNQVRRLEFYAGYQFIDFDHEVITNIYDYTTNELISRETTKLESPKGLGFAYTTMALVYDSSIFGATAPILGQSYIVELTPTVGSFTYAAALLDFRKYFMPVKPFTLAFRALHYGRWGKGGEDTRLWPLYIGYDTFVRGYYYNSFGANEYSDPSSRDYFDQNRLYGSKILVANVELRFPLFRVLGIGKGYYGILPIDAYAFYDWGVAWGYKDVNGVPIKPSFFGGDQDPVSSAGVGLRMNVFGYLVVGVNYVKPLSRPGKDWYFQFSIWPGF